MADSGAVCDTPVIHTDFYPTILELAGLPLMPDQHLDGVSLVPLLKGQQIPERDLYWHYPHYGNQGGEPSAIIRSGDWKLIHYYEDGRDELYNLADDIGEQTDLAAKTSRNRHETSRQDRPLARGDRRQAPHEKPQLRRRTWLPESRRRSVPRDLQAREQQHAGFLDPNFQPNKDWWGSDPAAPKTID